MSAEILPYFEQELAALREQGQEFAKAHPKLAKELNLDQQGMPNPHIERLLQATAFMNARIQHKLADEFPELHNTLLNILFPHILQPVPSMMLVQLQPQPDLAQAHNVPRDTLLEIDPTLGEAIPFRTCFDTQLLPLQISKAELLPHTEFAPKLSGKLAARGCLHIVLNGLDKDLQLTEFAPDKIRFALAGDPVLSFKLYDLIMRAKNQIALMAHARAEPVFLNADAVQPVGYVENQGLLPYAAHVGLGYRLLNEYFSFPQKFLFFEITGLTPRHWQQFGHRCELFIYLQETPEVDLQRKINHQHFSLNTTPVVNLAKRYAEPITVSAKKSSYPLVPDQRKFDEYEIYQIKLVKGITAEGQEKYYQPLYGFSKNINKQQQGGLWHAARQTVVAKHPTWELQLLQDNVQDAVFPEETVQVVLEYCQRNLPQHALFQNSVPVTLQLAETSAPLAGIVALTRPTAMLPVPSRMDWQWQLLAHLTMQQSSLFAREDRVQVLQEILLLQDRTGLHNHLVNSLRALTTRTVSRRMQLGGWPAILQGSLLELTVDLQLWKGSSLWLFGQVLFDFFNNLTAMNSFVELKILTEEGKLFYHWRPQLGQQPAI